MSPAAVSQQRHAALAMANKTRLAGAELRAEVMAGRTSMADALLDERAQCIPIGRLLESQPRWGKVKAAKLMRRFAIYPGKQVRDLTDRQKVLIGKATS